MYNEAEIREYSLSLFLDLKLSEIIDCFRGWVQNLQLK